MHLIRVLAATGAAAALAACDAADTEPAPAPREAAPAETPATGAPTPQDGPEPEEPEPREPEGDEPEPEAAAVEVAVTVVAEDLEAPWDVAFAPGGRVFVSERDRGRLLELHDGGVLETVQEFDVDARGEGGLLGLAASPDFADDGLLYAYYTTPADNRVVRFEPGEQPEVVLDGIPRAGNHNGGRIAFGPDGMLYVGTGDAGQAAAAQDPRSLAGKVLRLEPGGDVPGDNPDPDSPVYALGLRNVQGLAWTAGGDLYVGELGPDRDDEINLVEPGANYGWPEVTGEAGVEGFADPVFVAQPPEASWSGVATLADGAIPQWEGDLFVAALRGQRLWRLVLDDGGGVAEAEELLVGEYGRLRAVTQAPDGSLWVLTSNRDGRGSPAADDDRILRLGPPQ